MHTRRMKRVWNGKLARRRLSGCGRNDCSTESRLVTTCCTVVPAVSTSCCIISQWTDQWERANFDPQQLRNRFIDFDETRTLELTPDDHPPFKISFRSDDVVISANTQFTTDRCLSFSFFLFFFFGLVTRTGRNGGPILTIYTSYDV